MKKQVLESVGRIGMATSNDVAARLSGYGVSKENVSMTLLKCKRQGLVGRKMFRRGRVRGYVYWLLDRGKKRLLYYSKRVKANPAVGVVDIKRLVQDARFETAPLYFIACTAFDSEGRQCNGKWQDMRRTYLFLNKHKIVSAFASERILNILFPEVAESIRDALKEMTIEDMLEFSSIMNSYSGQSSSSTTPVSSAPLLNDPLFNTCFIRFMLSKKDEEIAYLLHLLTQTEKERDMYKTLYQTKVTKFEKPERYALFKTNAYPNMNSSKIGYSFGRMKVLNDQALSKGRELLSTLQERAAEEQRDKEHLQAVLWRKAINERWSDMLIPIDSKKEFLLQERPQIGKTKLEAATFQKKVETTEQACQSDEEKLENWAREVITRMQAAPTEVWRNMEAWKK